MVPLFFTYGEKFAVSLLPPTYPQSSLTTCICCYSAYFSKLDEIGPDGWAWYSILVTLPRWSPVSRRGYRPGFPIPAHGPGCTSP